MAMHSRLRACLLSHVRNCQVAALLSSAASCSSIIRQCISHTIDAVVISSSRRLLVTASLCGGQSLWDRADHGESNT